MKKDYLYIATGYNNEIRVLAARSTNLVAFAQKIHNLDSTLSNPFGQFLTVSLLMGFLYKDMEKISLRIENDSYSMITKSDEKGTIKGNITANDDFTTNPMLHVTRTLFLKQDFTSSFPLTTDLSKSFTDYFKMSEQINSLVALETVIDSNNSVIAAGGYILQFLPMASIKTINEVNKSLLRLNDLKKEIIKNASPLKIIKLLCQNNEKLLAKHPIKYRCNCSKNNYLKKLSFLNTETLERILIEDQKVEIICQYCNKKYLFSEKELQLLLKNKNAL